MRMEVFDGSMDMVGGTRDVARNGGVFGTDALHCRIVGELRLPRRCAGGTDVLPRWLPVRDVPVRNDRNGLRHGRATGRRHAGGCWSNNDT